MPNMPARAHDSFVSLPDIKLSPCIQLGLEDSTFSTNSYAHARVVGDLEKGLPAISTSPSAKSIAGPSSPPSFYARQAEVASTHTFGSPADSCRSLPYTGLCSDDGLDNDLHSMVNSNASYSPTVERDRAGDFQVDVLRTLRESSTSTDSSGCPATSTVRSDDAIYVTTELQPTSARAPSPPPFTNLGRPSSSNTGPHSLSIIMDHCRHHKYTLSPDLSETTRAAYNLLIPSC